MRQGEDELQQARAEIEGLVSTDWKRAADKLEALAVNQQYRESLIEWQYRAALIDRTRKKLPQRGEYSWTKARSVDGYLVSAGVLGSADGAGVSRWRPGNSNPSMGCVFSAAKL